MKIVSEAMRIGIVLMVASFATSIIDTLLRSVASVQYVMLELDDKFSPEIKNTIKTYINLQRVNHTYNTAALVNYLPMQFRSISCVQVERLPHNTARLIISAHNPLVSLNDERIFTDSGLILPQKDFESRLIAGLYNVAIPHECTKEICASLLKSVTQALTMNLLENYHLCWIDEHTILLKDKKNISTIVCSSETLPNEQMQARCIALTEQKRMQYPHKNWKTDIRFEDQIIVSMNKGGHDGTYI